MAEITNETDETIRIEPGEAITVRADEETRRIMTKRRPVLQITSVRE